MPCAIAAASRAWPSELDSMAASSLFFMFPHSMRIAGYWARFRPARSERP